MTKSLKITLVLFFVMQVLVAGSFELAHDEAYYWLYSKNLAWGYFDHPPFVGVIIRLFSFLPHGEWSTRIGFIFLQMGTLWTLFKMIPENKWWNTLWLFLAFPLASLVGLLALPDMPLLFMSGLYCLTLKKYLEKPTQTNVLLMGAVISGLLYAKYHGILLIFFTILAVPHLFFRKDFYVIAFIAILLFVPHIIWQWDHDFSTLRYHFLERPSSSFSFKRIFDYLSLQLFIPGLLVGPIVWWITFKHKPLSDFERAMKAVAFGVVVFFLISNFSKKFEANWTIPVMIPLIYLASLSDFWRKNSGRALLLLSVSIVVLSRFVFILPGDINPIKRISEFAGWKNWSSEVSTACGDETNIMANSYQIASKLSYYLEREIPSLNYHSRKNQFDYWRFDQALSGDKICYLTDKKNFLGEVIKTPEGKSLLIVKNLTLPQLQQMKADDIGQEKR